MYSHGCRVNYILSTRLSDVLTWPLVELIEDIYFFEVNTKYISLSVLKTSEFSRARSTSENYDVFNSEDEIYLVFTKKSKFLFILYFLSATRNVSPLKKEVLIMQNQKFSNPK